MTTFSCVVDRKNIGESSCKKGKLDNPSTVALCDENFIFTLAQANDPTFWSAAIKNKEVVLLPKIFNFEPAAIEATYAQTPFGEDKTSQGKYGFRLLYNVNIELHKNIYSWDGNLNKHILFDDQGKFMATLRATDTYGGLTPQLFSVENQIVDPGDATQTPVRVVYVDADEWNINGYIFTQSFLSQVKSLTTVDITVISGSTSQIIATVKNANDGSYIRGLLFDAFTYTGGAITDPLTEISAGTYQLDAATTFTDLGTLDLAAPSAQVQFIESSGGKEVTF